MPSHDRRLFRPDISPSWRGSCERYALSPVAAGSRWLLLLLSPLLSAAAGGSAWTSVTRLSAWCGNPSPAQAWRDAVRCSVSCCQARAQVPTTRADLTVCGPGPLETLPGRDAFRGSGPLFAACGAVPRAFPHLLVSANAFQQLGQRQCCGKRPQARRWRLRKPSTARVGVRAAW